LKRNLRTRIVACFDHQQQNLVCQRALDGEMSLRAFGTAFDEIDGASGATVLGLDRPRDNVKQTEYAGRRTRFISRPASAATGDL
jgi:hypothetical protein